MRDLPNAFVENTEALSAGQLGDTCDQIINDLSDKGYEVHLGLTPEFVEQINAMAHEPAILEYCPKDVASRFTDQAAAERWLSKKRAVFLLLDKSESGSKRLAGYGWAGEEVSEYVPGGKTSWAVRIGQAHQGRGLATPFSTLIVFGSSKIYGLKDIWLSTWASNPAAVHVYHKIGFKDVTSESSERRNLSGETIKDERLYMLLPNVLL